MKIVVIGAGIIGAAIAYNLSQRANAHVTIVERDQPGGGASAHSFAWTNAFDKKPREYNELNRNSMEIWPRFANAWGWSKLCTAVVSCAWKTPRLGQISRSTCEAASVLGLRLPPDQLARGTGFRAGTCRRFNYGSLSV